MADGAARDEEMRPLTAGEPIDKPDGAAVDGAPPEGAENDTPAGQNGSGTTELTTSMDDALDEPLTFREALAGLPLMCLSACFAFCAMLCVAGSGMHAYTLFQTVRREQLFRSLAALYDARDIVTEARYTAAVLLAEPTRTPSALLAVDNPRQFATLRSLWSGASADIPRFDEEGNPVKEHPSILQLYFHQLSDRAQSFRSAMDVAVDELPSTQDDATAYLHRVTQTGVGQLEDAVRLVRQRHTDGQPVPSADGIEAAMLHLDDLGRTLVTACAAEVLSGAASAWGTRLPALSCLVQEGSSAAYAAHGLQASLLQTDGRGDALEPQPAHVGVLLGTDADVAFAPVLAGEAQHLGSPTVEKTSTCARADPDETAKAALDRATATLNQYADAAHVGGEASLTKEMQHADFRVGGVELGRLASWTSDDVDGAFIAQLAETMTLRRERTTAMNAEVATLRTRATVSLVFCVAAAVVAVAGAVLSVQHLTQVVNGHAAFSRLQQRHAVLEDTAEIRGLRQELTAMLLPGWDEYVVHREALQRAEPSNPLRGTHIGLPVPGGKPSTSTAREDDIPLMEQSSRAGVLARVEQTNPTRNNINAATSPSVSPGQPANTAGEPAPPVPSSAPAPPPPVPLKEPNTAADDADSATGGDGVDPELCERLRRPLRDAIRRFVADLSATTAVLRSHVPQACFGDIEADHSAANSAGGVGGAAGVGAGGMAQGGRSGGGGGAGGVAGGGGGSVPIAGQQMLADIRSRELRLDRSLHVCYGTLMLVDCRGLLAAVPEAADFFARSEDSAAMASVIAPPFAALREFVVLLETVVNTHDGLLLGASGEEIGVLWGIVGQGGQSHARAVAAALALQQAIRERARAYREKLEEASAELSKRRAQLGAAQNGQSPANRNGATAAHTARARKAEAALAEVEMKHNTLKCLVAWFDTQQRRIGIASSVMSAGTVTATFHAAAGTSVGGQRGGKKGTAEGGTGIIDRSQRTLDCDPGATAKAGKKKPAASVPGRAGRPSKASGGGQLVVPQAAPRWFEAVGPAFGLASRMLRLARRLGLELLVTQDVAEAATGAAATNPSLLPQQSCNEDAPSPKGSNGEAPQLVVRSVGVFFQPAVGQAEESGNAARTGDGSGAAGGAAGGVNGAGGGATAGGGPRAASGNSGSGGGRASTMPAAAAKALQGQWTTVCSLFVGHYTDPRAPPAGWSECFEELERCARRANPAAGHKALKEYLTNAAAAAGGGGGGSGSASPTPQQWQKRAAVANPPSANDPVIQGWQSDLAKEEEG